MQFIKPLIIVIGIMAILAALTALYRAVEQSGYDRAIVEVKEQADKQRAIQLKEFNDKVGVAIHEAEYWRKVAKTHQDKPPIIVTKYIEKVIQDNPDCTHIVGFSELLNESRKRFNI